jgi:mannose-1-phosphate guanylyltransferase
MAGGQETRFWPLSSRAHRPKQFLNLTDDQKTILQSTVERIKPLVPAEQIFIATNRNYKKPIQEQLAEIPVDNIIIEPLKRNTAPSIVLSSLFIEKKYPGSTVLVLPADHLIQDEARFLDILKKAVENPPELKLEKISRHSVYRQVGTLARVPGCSRFLSKIVEN